MYRRVWDVRRMTRKVNFATELVVVNSTCVPISSRVRLSEVYEAIYGWYSEASGRTESTCAIVEQSLRDICYGRRVCVFRCSKPDVCEIACTGSSLNPERVQNTGR